MIKTLVILILAGDGLQTQHFVLDGDLRKFDRMSISTSAQPTPEHERLQDELFSTMFVLDEGTNLNVPRVKPVPEYHDAPAHTHRIKVRQ